MNTSDPEKSPSRIQRHNQEAGAIDWYDVIIGNLKYILLGLTIIILVGVIYLATRGPEIIGPTELPRPIEILSSVFDDIEQIIYKLINPQNNLSGE